MDALKGELESQSKGRGEGQPVDKSGKGQAAERRRRAADSHHLFCRALANLHSGSLGFVFPSETASCQFGIYGGVKAGS